MKRSALKSRINITSLLVIGIIGAILLSVVFLWLGDSNSTQSKNSTISEVSFIGEYKIGNGDWSEIIAGEHISSTKGDVALHGAFYTRDPNNNGIPKPVETETNVLLYFNHIGGSVVYHNGNSIPFNVENDKFGEDACAVAWDSIPVTGNEPITLLLHNPHKYGNENAIDDLLSNISIVPDAYRGSLTPEKGETQRIAGMILLISSLIILGITAFCIVIRVKFNKELRLVGFLPLFAGGYLLFDAFSVSMWNNSNITNTRMLGLCMMFYMLFINIFAVIALKNAMKKVSLAATVISLITIVCCITVSFSEKIKFYDTWRWWAAIQVTVAVTLIVCLAASFRKSSVSHKCYHGICAASLVAFITDCIATKIGWWEGGLTSKIVFSIAFILSLLALISIIPSHISSANRTQQLEAEQQVLRQELQESRISIMLSQMQPHFIFNTLNTIYHLCEINPDAARSTISSFSKYLRNNIDNLGQSEMISFEKELSFVKTYLDIEKVRFDDELLIYYDISTKDFKLPVLTVQPIVENAIKHGTSKKEGVSSIIISTRETPLHYEIEIRDTGVGFSSDSYQNDGHKHIGISSVKQRLKNLCDGSLTIESVRDEGTTAIIKIPKKELPVYENNSSR